MKIKAVEKIFLFCSVYKICEECLQACGLYTDHRHGRELRWRYCMLCTKCLVLTADTRKHKNCEQELEVTRDELNRSGKRILKVYKQTSFGKF